MSQKKTDLETSPGFSIIYRVLGRFRGDDETVRRLADFIASFDRTAVANRYINENHFYFVGKKV